MNRIHFEQITIDCLNLFFVNILRVSFSEFSTQGVLFSMSHLKDAFLVSATAARGTSALSMDRIQFPSLRYDYTIRHFYMSSQMGPEVDSSRNPKN